MYDTEPLQRLSKFVRYDRRDFCWTIHRNSAATSVGIGLRWSCFHRCDDGGCRMRRRETTRFSSLTANPFLYSRRVFLPSGCSSDNSMNGVADRMRMSGNIAYTCLDLQRDLFCPDAQKAEVQKHLGHGIETVSTATRSTSGPTQHRGSGWRRATQNEGRNCVIHSTEKNGTKLTTGAR